MLIFVRHGRTAANAAGLLQGRVDNALDDHGRRQAEAIAIGLGALQQPLVVSSPLLRARQTAEALGLPVQLDERFIELDYGGLDEVPVRDVGADVWARWRSDPHYVPAGGESLFALQQRVEDACRAYAEEAAGRDVVVFSHVSPIKAAVAWALGVGPETSWRMNLGQATITRIRSAPGAPALLSFNNDAHLIETRLE
ncbi:MAG: histidine phosphatase family protein [Acidimicrobiales bacterium]|nr:histidine phosphatase family protein [Acidimicrobiales bacterium]